MIEQQTSAGGSRLAYRHRLPVRLWHWSNALAIFMLLMSGLAIFNAHPRLYWGEYGARADPAWLEIGRREGSGYLRVGTVILPTFGPVGTVHNGRKRAFGPSLTIPSGYDLGSSRSWHFAFAWLLAVPGLAFLLWGLIGGHLRREVVPGRADISPRHLWRDIKEHVRLRFPTGEAALRYNPLQKIAYFLVICLLLPVVVLTGLAMSPAMDAAWPWLTEMWGGRQTARSIHFLCAASFALFIVVHLAMVLLSAPINGIRAMITGRWRVTP